MSSDNGPVLGLEQRCVEPGHWLIEGRHVRAVYYGRGRTITAWVIGVLDGETDPGPMDYLRDCREWIRDQEAR